MEGLMVNILGSLANPAFDQPFRQVTPARGALR